ncbi:hypothetical protein CL629_02680 [bacterium]|nr:hypothetical protein [bacterium]
MLYRVWPAISAVSDVHLQRALSFCDDEECLQRLAGVFSECFSENAEESGPVPASILLRKAFELMVKEGGYDFSSCESAREHARVCYLVCACQAFSLPVLKLAVWMPVFDDPKPRAADEIEELRKTTEWRVEYEDEREMPNGSWAGSPELVEALRTLPDESVLVEVPHDGAQWVVVFFLDGYLHLVPANAIDMGR